MFALAFAITGNIIGAYTQLATPREMVYPIQDEQIATRLEISTTD